MTADGSCPSINAMHGHDAHVVALGGDKLKPREGQRKGGSGFGVNEDGAGGTLSVGFYPQENRGEVMVMNEYSSTIKPGTAPGFHNGVITRKAENE